MGFLSGLFGGNKQVKALQQAFEHIKRVLEDEEFQLDLINPAMKEMIKNCPAYDKDPNGTGPFGLSEKNQGRRPTASVSRRKCPSSLGFTSTARISRMTSWR